MIKQDKLKKIIWIVVLATFAFYCFMLFIRLFVDGRVSIHFENGYFAQSNLIPFKTVYDYIVKLANDRINVDTVVINLIGNLIAFFPMGCYLPCLFEKIRTVKMLSIVILGMLLVVEILQPLLGIGFLDIDDIIFNFAGAIAGYGIVHISPINRLLKRVYIYK